MIALLAACSSGPAGTVLFVRERDRVPQTWVGPIGGPYRRLLDRPGAVFPADPDPQGTDALLVATDDDPEGHHEQLLLAPLAGGEPRPLCPPASTVRNPTWSADGGWVVFESDALSFRDLFRVDRDGGHLQRLTEAPYGSFEPAVGPDGQIAFGTSRDGNAELYVMSATGADPLRLTADPADDVHPRWLPDGRLAWLATRAGHPRVWTVHPDGADPAPLRPDDGAVDLDFAVSVDGRLAITTQRGAEVALELVGPDGVVVVVDGPGPDEHPAWSADGSWLLFTSSRAGQPDLWRVDRDGAHPTRVSDDPAPEWLPRVVGPR